MDEAVIKTYIEEYLKLYFKPVLDALDVRIQLLEQQLEDLKKRVEALEQESE